MLDPKISLGTVAGIILALIIGGGVLYMLGAGIGSVFPSSDWDSLKTGGSLLIAIAVIVGIIVIIYYGSKQR